MALASMTLPTSTTVSTAQSHGVSGALDASQAQSEGLVTSSAASIADSIADAALEDASTASVAAAEAKSTGLVDSSAASVTKSLAVYSDPGSGEYHVKEVVMDNSLDMIVTYEDSSVA